MEDNSSKALIPVVKSHQELSQAKIAQGLLFLVASDH